MFLLTPVVPLKKTSTEVIWVTVIFSWCSFWSIIFGHAVHLHYVQKDWLFFLKLLVCVLLKKEVVHRWDGIKVERMDLFVLHCAAFNCSCCTDRCVWSVPLHYVFSFKLTFCMSVWQNILCSLFWSSFTLHWEDVQYDETIWNLTFF